MTDAVVVQWSMHVPQASYGQQRVFASLAWGIGSFFVGHLIDRSALPVVYTYTYCMMSWTLLLIGFLHWRRSCWLRRPSIDDGSGSPGPIKLPPSSSAKSTKDVRTVLRNLHLLFQRPSIAR